MSLYGGGNRCDVVVGWTLLISSVFSFNERPARLQPSLSATTDGKTLYFAQYDRQSVIKMMQFEH